MKSEGGTVTRVLVTRAEPDGQAFAELCRENGLVPILCPVMRIEIEQASLDMADISVLAFTSANGVRAFAANSERRDMAVFAVGSVTAAAAKAAGFQEVHAADGDVQSLASHLASESELAKKGVLHIAGQNRAGDLVSLLGARGLRARRQTLYAAKPAPALTTAAASALSADDPLWVSLFSPRTAMLFLELVAGAGLRGHLKRRRAACLSNAVAEAAVRVDWTSIETAPERNAESLAAMMARLSHKGGAPI